MMNDIFREYLNGFVVIHLNDVLIFFKNEKKYEKYVQLIINKLLERGLYAKLENGLFHQT